MAPAAAPCAMSARQGAASTSGRVAWAPPPPPAHRRGRCRAPPRAPRAAAASPGLLPYAGASASAYEQLQYEMGYCRLNQPYSPALVAREAAGTPAAAAACAARAARVAAELAGFAARLWLDDLAGRSDDRAAARARAVLLRDMLTRLGPTFIKAGQVLANRPDIVREDTMNELCVLQDDVPPFPDAAAFAAIEAQLGRPLGEVFSAISDRPVAAASLGQVYRATLRDGGAEVAVKVQRPGVEPLVFRDLFIFRALAALLTPLSLRRLGCNAELVVDEFGEKLLEELDYVQEAKNIEDFGANFAGDARVKIPWVRRDLSGPKVLVMEWIDGIRCTDVEGLRRSGLDLQAFIRTGVVSGLRQLLEFGLFHGDPHPGNIFALRDGRIAYVDFGNVAQLSRANKEVLTDAVVHAVNADYASMAGDFIKLGFLADGTDVAPIVPALEKIWADSLGASLADFNFRSVTSRFNELVFQYPIRIPERYALVIRSLLTQEGICLTLDPGFHFLEVAYPYVARRLLTDEDPALRARLLQVLFQGGRFQWERLENLVRLAREGGGGGGAGAAGAAGASSGSPAPATPTSTPSGGGIDLTDTISDGLRLVLTDSALRSQLLLAFTEDERLHVGEVARLLALLRGDVDVPRALAGAPRRLGEALRRGVAAWSDRVLAG